MSIGIGAIIGGGFFATFGLAVVGAQGSTYRPFLLGGVLVLLTALIANASNRIKNPRWALPIAYYGSIVVYVLAIIVAIGHMPFEAIINAEFLGRRSCLSCLPSTKKCRRVSRASLLANTSRACCASESLR